jgi:hypothetical protein
MLPHSYLLSVLGAAAIDARARGNDAETVEILRDMLAGARRFQSFPTLLGSVFDARVSDQVAGILAVCGPHIRIANRRRVPEGEGRPASRRQVEDVIADLLDERASREALQTGFCAERLLAIKDIKIATSGDYSLSFAPATGSSPATSFTSSRSTWARSVGFLVKPVLELDGVWLLRYTTAFAQAAGASDCATALRHLPAPVSSQRTRGLAGMAHVLSVTCAPNFQGTVKEHFCMLARRRMAAAALAIRLYELDHGRLPGQLDQLVPRYVPAVPSDPFTDDGRSIGYRPGANPPVLYSVGPLPDKGGKTAEITFPLRAKPSATAPSRAQSRPVSP